MTAAFKAGETIEQMCCRLYGKRLSEISHGQVLQLKEYIDWSLKESKKQRRPGLPLPEFNWNPHACDDTNQKSETLAAQAMTGGT